MSDEHREMVNDLAKRGRGAFMSSDEPPPQFVGAVEVVSDNPADSLRRGHQPPEPGSQAKPKFGDQITNCMASRDNPHRVGQFVRVVRVTSRMNRGKWWEVTDGEGEFWQCSPANCYVVPVSAGLVAARADEREKIAKAVRAEKVECPDHPPMLPKPSCWTCGRNGAFERAARRAVSDGD